MSLHLTTVIAVGNFRFLKNKTSTFTRFVEFCEVCCQSDKSPRPEIRRYKERPRSAPINYHLVVNLLKLPFSIHALPPPQPSTSCRDCSGFVCKSRMRTLRFPSPVVAEQLSLAAVHSVHRREVTNN